LYLILAEYSKEKDSFKALHRHLNRNHAIHPSVAVETALVLCEGYFGTPMGKTANGLVRRSKRFRIAGVIDSRQEGRDAGEVLDGKKCGIPVFKSVDDAVAQLKSKPMWLIIGVASIGGMLPSDFRPAVKKAIEEGIGIISGLHEFLADDAEFTGLAEKHGIQILDIRREPTLEKLHAFMNRCAGLPVVRIPVLGTDSSIGKRTSALKLADALNEAGIRTEFVATGQTGLLQGAKYGVPLDAIQGDYMVGELENAIVSAYDENKPDIIIIEGQGSISHPAYVCGTRAIINASKPSGIILQHAPGRKIRNYKKDLLKLPMPDLADEIRMLEMFSKTKVIAITINHENMTDDMIRKVKREYEKEFGIPAADVLKFGCDEIVKKIRELYSL